MRQLLGALTAAGGYEAQNSVFDCRSGALFVDAALAAKKPFFLYLAHNAPHFPLQAPQEEIAAFRVLMEKDVAFVVQRHHVAAQ